tara:strand:+ start:680 stop:1084 length:405 start_codon:yes stop_codon:yes gene_type:complete
MNMVSLLIAVVIGSISYVTFYQIMGGFQASQNRPVEIVDMEWGLRNTHEQFLWEIHQAEIDGSLNSPIMSSQDLINSIEYFKINISVPNSDGSLHLWATDFYEYSLKELSLGWFELKVSNPRGISKVLIWKAQI